LAKRTSKNTKKKSSDEQGGGYLKELTALVLIALATLLALSLVSYNPHDDTPVTPLSSYQ